MIHQHGKHVILECSLEVGDIVQTEIGGYKTTGKNYRIKAIRREVNCESGFTVLLEGLEPERFIDSNWIIKF